MVFLNEVGDIFNFFLALSIVSAGVVMFNDRGYMMKFCLYFEWYGLFCLQGGSGFNVYFLL